jgi:hypothetical protein
MTRVRLFALLAAVAALSSCIGWSAPRPLAPSPLDTIPAHLRVTLTDGRRLVLPDARVHGDSLVGDTLSEFLHAARMHVSIPLARIRSVSTREMAQGRTLLLLVTVGAIAALSALSFSWSGAL